MTLAHAQQYGLEVHDLWEVLSASGDYVRMTLEQRNLLAAFRDVLAFFAHSRDPDMGEIWDSLGARMRMVATMGGFLPMAGEEGLRMVQAWALESIPVSLFYDLFSLLLSSTHGICQACVE